MITGRVTADHEARVRLQLRAADGSLRTVEVVIDTGFTEFLALPPDQIAALGLTPEGLQEIFLADGSPALLLGYEAAARWHDAEVTVEVLEVDGDALIGMSLLEGSLLTMEVARDGAVRIEPMTRR
ncbi:MAG: clan AA aspartic protease [Planctomycetes bacterium]|nr:clan AA aspartic protease [Planctomycetota bacterium]